MKGKAEVSTNQKTLGNYNSSTGKTSSVRWMNSRFKGPDWQELKGALVLESILDLLIAHDDRTHVWGKKREAGRTRTPALGATSAPLCHIQHDAFHFTLMWGLVCQL